MYAAYHAEIPSRQTTRATTFTRDDDFLDDASDRGNNFPGRIFTYCVAGTLGLLTPLYVHASSATANWSINGIEFNDAQVATADAKCPTSNDIALIRQVMKISISELAKVFDVSRQAVHEWIKGGALSPRNAQRVAALAQVADVFLNSGIDVTPQVLRRKIEGGQSLLDSITGEGNVVEQARRLVDTLSRESQQRQRLAARLAGRQKIALSPESFGAPHLHEDA